MAERQQMSKKIVQEPENLEEKVRAMRAGGKILGGILRDLKEYVKPGMTGKEVDAWVRSETERRGAKVAYDYLEEDFPGAICISINDEIVHGIPTDYAFEEGTRCRSIWTCCIRVIIRMRGSRCWSEGRVRR